MKRWLSSAALALISAGAAHATGEVHAYGNWNGTSTIATYGGGAASICNTQAPWNCHRVYGLDLMYPATEVQVSQHSQWRRSALLGRYANTLVACFLYYDNGTVGYWTCRSQALAYPYTDQQAANQFYALAWQAYYGTGLTPLSVTERAAVLDRKNKATAAAIARGTMATAAVTTTSSTMTRARADNTESLVEEEEPDPISAGGGGGSGGGGTGGTGGGGGGDGGDGGAAQTLDMVWVIGSRDRDAVTDASTGLSLLPSVSAIGGGGGGDGGGYWIWNPCVSFDTCSTPPPPPPVDCAKRKAVCDANAAILDNTCNETTAEMGAAFGTGAVVTGLITGIALDPLAGWAFFKVVGGAGGIITGGYAFTCKTILLPYARKQCMGTCGG